MTDAATKIMDKLDQIQRMLLEKNAAYGNSALEPVECFATGLTPVQRMGVRMDDKLSRLMRGGEYPGDDTLLDLVGYLVLLLIARDDEVPKLAPAADPIIFRKHCGTLLEHAAHNWYHDILEAEYRCAGTTSA